MGTVCVKGEQTEISTRAGLRANVELSPSGRERTQDPPKPPTEAASQGHKEPTPDQQQTQVAAQQTPLFDGTMGDASNLVIVLGASVSSGIHGSERIAVRASVSLQLMPTSNWNSSLHVAFACRLAALVNAAASVISFPPCSLYPNML